MSTFSLISYAGKHIPETARAHTIAHPAARQVLAEWDRSSTEQANRISSRFLRCVLAFAVAFVISALVCLVWTEEPGGIIPIAALVSFVLVWGVTSRRAREWGRRSCRDADKRDEDRP